MSTSVLLHFVFVDEFLTEPRECRLWLVYLVSLPEDSLPLLICGLERSPECSQHDCIVCVLESVRAFVHRALSWLLSNQTEAIFSII